MNCEKGRKDISYAWQTKYYHGTGLTTHLLGSRYDVLVERVHRHQRAAHALHIAAKVNSVFPQELRDVNVGLRKEGRDKRIATT